MRAPKALGLLLAFFAAALLFAPAAEGRGRRFRQGRSRVVRQHGQLPKQDAVPRPGLIRPQGGVSAFSTGTAIPDPSAAETSVTSYGAVPNDGLDDAPAFARLLTAVRIGIANNQYNQVIVHIPGGVYDLDRNNPLHALIQEDGTLASSTGLPTHAIKFVGDSQNYSVLKLHRDSGNPRWYVDSTPVASDGGGPSWRRPEFESLWFISDDPDAATDNTYDPTYAADCNGFKQFCTVATGGVDKGYVFRNCRFNALGNPFYYTGTSNSESNNHYSCWFSNCGPIVWSNDQALLTNFYSCHFYSSDDCFSILATAGTGAQSQGGGGSIACYSGDFIQFNALGDTTPHYTLRIADGASFYRQILFVGGKWEFRNPEARLIKWPGTASFLTGSHVTFQDCDMSIAQQGSASYGGAGNDTGYTSTSLNGYRYFVSIGVHKRVVFDRCVFADQLAFEFTDVNTSSIAGFGHQPIVELRGCQIPQKFLSGLNDAETATESTRGLTARISQNNGYGRVIASDCYLRDATSTAGSGRYAVDFDFGADSAVRGEPGVRKKKVYLKAQPQAWPSWSGGVAASERTIWLPEGAKITAVGIDKAAGGSAATLIQYRLGSDDKATSYCATGPIRADGHHKAMMNEATSPATFPLRVGTDINLRKVRLWMGPVEHAGTTSSGEAWVEYE